MGFVDIRKKEIDVDAATMTANINASGNEIYIVQEGKVLMYPLPRFGKIELSSQNYKIGKPKYQISAD